MRVSCDAPDRSSILLCVFLCALCVSAVSLGHRMRRALPLLASRATLEAIRLDEADLLAGLLDEGAAGEVLQVVGVLVHGGDPLAQVFIVFGDEELSVGGAGRAAVVAEERLVRLDGLGVLAGLFVVLGDL